MTAQRVNAEFCSSSQLKQIFKDTPKNKIVFWVGAGIDRLFPTCLPNGEELLIFFLDNTVGRLSSEEIRDLWEKNKKIINNDNEFSSFSGIPRLETIIDRCFRLEKNLHSCISFTKGLSSFANAPFNDNHYVIAKLIGLGASVVTTNFTLCIQKAFEHIYGENVQLESEKGKKDYFMPVFSSSKEGSGKIFHIHGVANRLNDLGVTLEQIAQGISSDFSRQLNYWMDNEYTFIFVGYSGSDAFDVNRFFLEKKPQDSNSTGIYIRYSNEDVVDYSLTKPLEKENILLHAFRQSYISLLNTTNFLLSLVEVDSYLKSPAYEWQGNFLNCSDRYPEDVKIALAVNICYFLGINIEAISSGVCWVEKVDNKSIFSNWYSDYTCFHMGRLQANSQLLSKYKDNLLSYNKDTEYIKSIYYSSIGDYSSCAKYTIPLGEAKRNLLKKVQTGEVVDWATSQPFDHHSKRIISIITANPSLLVENIKRFSKEALIIIECYKILQSLEYSFLAEIHQISVAQRNLSILLQLFCDQHLDAINMLYESTYYFSEVSSVDGIIGNYNTYFFIYSHEYYKTKCGQARKQSEIYLQKAEKLIKSNQHIRHKSHLVTYIEFFKLLNGDIYIGG